MARRGKRDLTEEERALWKQIADRVHPMHSARRPVAAPEEGAPAPRPASVASPPAGPRPLPPRAPEPPGQVTYDLAPDPHALLDRAHPHMDRRRFDTLRRGRMEPEARLDLHGMTAERAHSALTGFILGAHASGLRLVLVITGKGGAAEADPFGGRQRGVLRHSLPHWLAMAPLAPRVLQVAPAHRKHGGGGAYYIYLRRARTLG